MAYRVKKNSKKTKKESSFDDMKLAKKTETKTET